MNKEKNEIAPVSSRVVTHTQVVSTVGVDVGIGQYHVGFFVKNETITDEHTSPQKVLDPAVIEDKDCKY